MTESLDSQIDRLAKFIMENVPGEPSQSDGAVDTAIRIMASALTRIDLLVSQREQLTSAVNVYRARAEAAEADLDTATRELSALSSDKQTLMTAVTHWREQVEGLRAAAQALYARITVEAGFIDDCCGGDMDDTLCQVHDIQVALAELLPGPPGGKCATCGQPWRGYTAYDGKTTTNICRTTPNQDGTWNTHSFVEEDFEYGYYLDEPAPAATRPVPPTEPGDEGPLSRTTTSKPWGFEVCKVCHRKNLAAFRVTNRMWMRVMELDSPDGGGVVCVWCFDDLATAKGIDWTEEPIEWHPVSTIANQQWGEIEQTGPFNLAPAAPGDGAPTNGGQ